MNLLIALLWQSMKRWVCIALLGSVGVSGHAADRIFTVAADPWCPFNCVPNSSRPGYMVDLLGLILKPHGFNVVYKVLPWNRAVANAETGEIDGVLAAGEDDATKLLSPKHPQAKRLAELIDEGIARLRKSGELKTVMGRYGLTDWQ